MGRKIPAKKHRGVKDPLEQQARRLQSLKGKINAPPQDPDEQPVPKSLTRLFAFQHKGEKTDQKKKKNKPTPVKDVGPASGVGKNPIARLKQLPGESGRGFSLRINSAIRALHDPLEQDYPEDLEADDVKGEQMAAQRERRRRKRRKGNKGEEPEEKLTRTQKFALKKQAKKQKAEEESRPEVVYERVGFGDVTHAPPALPVRPRRATATAGAQRPGRRDLLLTSLLQGSNTSSKKPALPPAELLRRERARLDVVAAYRELKKQKMLEQKTKRKSHDR